MEKGIEEIATTKIRGTNVSSPIRPFTTVDKFPTAHSNELLGGMHSCNTMDEMYEIPKERRQLYMTCMVKTDMYILTSNPDTPKTNLTNWTKYTAGNTDVGTKTIEVDGEMEVITDIITKLKLLSQVKYLYFVSSIKESSINKVELYCPFDCYLHKINSIVPLSSTMENNISLELQLYSNGNWKTLSRIDIDKDTKEGSVEVDNTLIRAGTRLTITAASTIPLGLESISTCVEVRQKI